MTLKEILNESIVISLLRYFYRGYDCLWQRLSHICCHSQTYKLSKRFYKAIKICFRNSFFFGRISEVKQTTPAILDNSRLVQYLVSFYKKCVRKIIHYLSTSLMFSLGKNIKEDLYSFTVRTISIIAVSIIIANIVLVVILQRQIGLWGWVMRGLFLFVAVAGVFCNADWPTIIGGSVIFGRPAKR